MRPTRLRTLLAAAVGLLASLAAGPPAACAGNDDERARPPIVIVSEFPGLDDGFNSAAEIIATLNNAIRLAIRDQNGKIGDYRIVLRENNHAAFFPEFGGTFWSPDLVIANSRASVADPSVAGVIGTYNSGAAGVAIPILQPAGLVMISPSNTFAGLTRPEFGAKDIYDPAYPRNYARTIPADHFLGAAGAVWAEQLRARRVVTVFDGGDYGFVLRATFEAEAKRLGLDVAARLTFRPGPDGFPENMDAIVQKIVRRDPDLVYFAGFDFGFELIAALREGGYGGLILGGDGILFSGELPEEFEGVLSTLAGLDPSAYRGDARKWRERYVASYHGEPDRYAIYAYAATRALLAGIERVVKSGRSPFDRAAVRDEVMLHTRNFQSRAIPPFSIDRYGDPTATDTSAYEVIDGFFQYVQGLRVP